VSRWNPAQIIIYYILCSIPGRIVSDQKCYENSSSENNESENEESIEWTTVQRRRAYSKDSSRKRRGKVSKETPNPVQNSRTELTNVIMAAEKNLTPAQKEHIVRRHEKIASVRRTRYSSRGEEGPSKPKGKGTDPREWGNVSLSREEMDPERQRHALNKFAKQNHQRTRETPPHVLVIRSSETHGAQRNATAPLVDVPTSGKLHVYLRVLHDLVQTPSDVRRLSR